MKHIYCILIYFTITFLSIAQQNIKNDFGQFYPRLLSHDKTAEWPSKSFYQRKGEWQYIIDSTWGYGLEVSQKRAVFTKCADYVEENFALFHRLDCDWDSLRSYWWNQITDSTSKGGFSAILSHLFYNLKDAHSKAWSTDIGSLPLEEPVTKLNPGVPILAFSLDASHFGAILTTNENDEIFVIKSVESHPLGLEPGDVILGYEGVKWIYMVDELLDAHIPIIGSLPTTEEARIHGLLICAGINWHLFSTIDIVKYKTGDTLHLSLEPMIQLETDKMDFAEQLDIPGVSIPNFLRTGETASYGKIENTNIGLVYIHAHMPADQTNKSTNHIFYDAIHSLYDTDGLIIDLRFDPGGFIFQNLNNGLDLLSNELIDIINQVRRCDPSNLFTLCDYTNSYWESLKLNPDPNTFYDKPIAVLVGPYCFSMGDITATRLSVLPNLKFFGQTTGGAFGEIYTKIISGYYLSCQVTDTYHSSKPYEYLSGTEFPVDEKVWLTKDDVALGEDTVVKEAISWINNLSHSYNADIDKSYSKSQINFIADIINPNEHELSVIAKLENDYETIDSTDCEISNDKVIGSLDVSAYTEDFYSISILTKDLLDSTTHTLPNIVRFTNVGPVVIDTFEVSQINDLNRLRISNISAINQSLTKTIDNVIARFYSEDSSIRKISGIKNFFSLLPQEKKIASGSIYVEVDTIKDYTFIAEISSENIVYWKDTISYVHPVVGVELAENLPTEYSLTQNYPNPFNPVTTIKYSIPVGVKSEKAKVKNVELKIFDILGRKVAILVNEKQKPGNYEVKWKADQYPSGIYLYRLTVEKYTETKKMILIK